MKFWILLTTTICHPILVASFNSINNKNRQHYLPSNTAATTTLYSSSLSDPITATTPCIIKVLGVGGGGGNAVNRMVETQIEGVQFWAINTDSQALMKSLAPNTLNIGRELTRGLGAGGDPSVGEAAARESREEVRQICKASDLVFVTSGMGGGTGSGAAPIVAEIAREEGCLTIGVVTKPFQFEGRKRLKQAVDAIDRLKDHVDTLIVVSNDKLLQIVPDNTPVTDAFLVADDILRQGVVGISEIIVKPGLINVDFADVRAVMKDAGTALMGVGTGSGRTRAQDAAVAAISSPLLDFPIDRAQGIVFNVVGGPNLSLAEINAAAEVIYENAADNANIIFGSLIDESMGDDVSITVLATGFESQKAETINQERRDPEFYKERRMQTLSPLGPNATLDETRKAITDGTLANKMKNGATSSNKDKSKEGGVVSGFFRRLRRKKNNKRS